MYDKNPILANRHRATGSGDWIISRLMQLWPVYEHHKLGKDNLWAKIRCRVCHDLFDAQIYLPVHKSERNIAVGSTPSSNVAAEVCI